MTRVQLKANASGSESTRADSTQPNTVSVAIALIKGMHARFILPCNDTPQISQLIKFGVVGQQTVREQQKGLTKTNTHSIAIHTHHKANSHWSGRQNNSELSQRPTEICTDTHWDEPTENIIYLEYVANIFKEKNPSKKPQ